MAAFTPSFGDRLVERYEELRRQAAGELGRGAGMVVFLRQGMKVWMDSWSKWASEAYGAALKPIGFGKRPASKGAR